MKSEESSFPEEEGESKGKTELAFKKIKIFFKNPCSVSPLLDFSYCVDVVLCPLKVTLKYLIIPLQILLPTFLFKPGFIPLFFYLHVYDWEYFYFLFQDKFRTFKYI